MKEGQTGKLSLKGVQTVKAFTECSEHHNGLSACREDRNHPKLYSGHSLIYILLEAHGIWLLLS